MPSQTLSQGLERMMKVALFLSNNAKKGEFKKKAHSLNKLWNKLKECDIVEPISDPYFDSILNILSKFGQNARYYYISILDDEPSDFNPQFEWEKLESLILDETPQRYKMLTNGDEANDLIKEMVRRLQIPIEKVINSLSMVIVNYGKNEVGWVVPPTIKAFANFNKDTFGMSIYHEWPQCLEIKLEPYKRNWCDLLICLFNPFRKSKVIYKKDYQREWPFREIKKVRIEKRKTSRGLFHVITINGYDCALDGRTSSLLHLARPHEAGLAVVGISIQPFLDLAKEL